MEIGSRLTGNRKKAIPGCKWNDVERGPGYRRPFTSTSSSRLSNLGSTRSQHPFSALSPIFVFSPIVHRPDPPSEVTKRIPGGAGFARQANPRQSLPSIQLRTRFGSVEGTCAVTEVNLEVLCGKWIEFGACTNKFTDLPQNPLGWFRLQTLRLRVSFREYNHL